MRFALIIASLLALLPCTALAGGSLPITTISGNNPPTTAPIPQVTVMLLPFRAVDPTGQNEWISQAIDEDLAHDLSRNSAIRVVRSATTQPLAAEDGLAAAREAKAPRLISGSYQVVEDQLRINAEVIDVEQSQSIGQIKATGGVRDLFKMEDSLASQLWHILPRPTQESTAADFQVQSLDDYLAAHPSPAVEGYQSPETATSPPVVYDSSPDLPAYDEGYPYAGYGYGYPYNFGFPLFIYGGYGRGFYHHGDHPHYLGGNRFVGAGGRTSSGNARMESPQAAAPHISAAPAFHDGGGAHFGAGGFGHR